jgi:hypothetical protein
MIRSCCKWLNTLNVFLEFGTSNSVYIFK